MERMSLVDPDTFGARLAAAGFEVLEIEKTSDAFRFLARRPAERFVRKRLIFVATIHARQLI